MLTKELENVMGSESIDESWRSTREITKKCAASCPDKRGKSKQWFDEICKEKLEKKRNYLEKKLQNMK